MSAHVKADGQILRTTEGDLLSSGGPFQMSPTGRKTLAMSSVPFATLGASALTLIGGRTVSYNELYKTQPWVAAAVNKRFRPIVRLPLKVYKLNSQGDKVRVRDHRLAELIKTPWKRASSSRLKQEMFAPVYVHGNSVLAKERKSPGAPPSSFRPLDWRWLQPLVFNGQLEAWETREFGEREFFAPEDVLHLNWWGPDGPFGVSPLQQLGITVRIEQAAQEYQQAYLGNAALPPSALYLPKDVFADETVKGQIRADMNDRHGGPSNAGNVALLPGDTEWKEVGHTAQEAELIQQRQLAREEVAAVYDMPPTLIGNLDKATYSNIETQGGWLYTDILGPDLVLNEQEFNAQVVADEPAFDGLFVEYDLAGVLRGDKLKEIQALREAIGSALLKPQEGRNVLNLPVYGDPNADDNPANKLYLPTNNLSPIGEAPPSAPPEDQASARVAAAIELLSGLNGHH